MEVDGLLNRLQRTTGRRPCHFHKNELHKLLGHAREVMAHQPTLLRITPPVHVLGDIHGQFDDLLRLLAAIGPQPDRQLLLLGDYVDRGERSIEVMALLFALKIKYPTRVHLLRGNHEFDLVNRSFGFQTEVLGRTRDSLGGDPVGIYEAFQQAFDVMPLTALIGSRILCMHGGVSHQLHDLRQLETLPRPLRHLPEGESLVADLLWADPCDDHGDGYHKSERGISWCFSEEAADKKCLELGIEMIVRGHSFEPGGYKLSANQRVVTVFSAPNYAGRNINPAGVLSVDAQLRCTLMTMHVDRNANTGVASGSTEQPSSSRIVQ